MQASQSAARDAARSQTSNVPNGLGTGGLERAAGAVPGSDLWQGANLPTQFSDGDRVKVNIDQTQQKAILTWKTFNVGSKTDLNFNQQGNSNWIALNRVLDPDARPSQILGSIKADGAVYVINRNGIIFGGGSQINVHALIATDLDIGDLKLGNNLAARNSFFLDSGIGSVADPIRAFSMYDDQSLDPAKPEYTNKIGGGIEVQKGATITTNVLVPDTPGFVYLFGSNVTNRGTITAPAGEVAMIAGARGITLTPAVYPAADFPAEVLPRPERSGDTPPFRGVGFTFDQYRHFSLLPNGTCCANINGDYVPDIGEAANHGLIETARGVTVMNGNVVTLGREGIISADTSITRNSMVLLEAADSVHIDGTISILPYLSDETLPILNGAATNSSGSAVQSFMPAFVDVRAPGSVTFGAESLIKAPAATVSIHGSALVRTSDSSQPTPLISPFQSWSVPHTGIRGVVLESGSIIDVSGLQDVELPASYNFISFQPRGPEFADFPLQRRSALAGQTLWIDIRDHGVRSDGSAWVGTPLADASGYVGQVGQSIEQLMTKGGSVMMSINTSDARSDVFIREGAIINVAGGSVKFLSGMVPVTRLLGSNGAIYSMANADPNMTYLGVVGGFTRSNAHWGVTQTWSNPLIKNVRYEPGYIEGHDAGGVTIDAINPWIDGTFYFGAPAGKRQIVSGLAPTGSGVVPTQASRDELPSQGYLSIASLSSFVIGSGQQTSSSASANFQPQASLLSLSADALSRYGLSGLILSGFDLVVEKGSTLALAPGGRLSVRVGGPIDIAGTVVAQGGAVSLTTDPYGLNGAAPSKTASGDADIFVGGAINVSGRWVNDFGIRDAAVLSGPGFIDGGSITLATSRASTGAKGRDTTGSILLAEGSLLDASSGGYISVSGPKLTKSGVMAGRGGSISLGLYQLREWGSETGTGAGPYVPATGTPAEIVLGGELRAWGFETNGSLTLIAPQTIKLGGDPLQAGSGLYLSESFLNEGGFGAYRFESAPHAYYNVADPANIVVVEGTHLALKQKNLSSYESYLGLPTGARIAATAPLAILPDDLRNPVDLALASTRISLEDSASIVTDPRAEIVLEGVARVDGTRQRAQSLLLRGSIVNHAGSVVIQADQTWLGPQARVDLSGIFVQDSRFGLPGGSYANGTLYGGGSLSINPFDAAITSSPVGYVVSEAGAVVDVSGVAATLMVRNMRTGLLTETSVSALPSWSDAGTVEVNTGAFLWAGSFAAREGDPRANGGTLILGGGTNGVYLVQESGLVSTPLGTIVSPTTPDALGSLATGFGGKLQSLDGLIVAAADKLSDFENVYLYSGRDTSAYYGPQLIFNDLPIDPAVLATSARGSLSAPQFRPLTVIGDLDWKTASRLHLAASGISGWGNVTITAPYVQLTGGGGAASGGSGSLTVTAQTIDVEGASFAGFGAVALDSAGDLRLGTSKVRPVSQLPTAADLPPFKGKLAAGNDLLLSAERIYPVTAVDFTIEAAGSVHFSSPAGSRTDAPLSAGASLTVSAPDIRQDGNLFAPLGQITLGTEANQKVTLGAGSLTSVSLGDNIVPYGETLDSLNWYYNAAQTSLTVPPAKRLVLNGGDVTVADGAVIDVSGGGDLQAMEFIAGKGGTRDVLKSQPSGPTVYALVPSHNDAVAAFDVHFTAVHGGVAGDAVPIAGMQIYVEAGNGIPAGTYTLYPAHYATLPGAMRVTVYRSGPGYTVPAGLTLPDGTMLVSGYYTQSTRPDARSSGTTVFAIQTQDVWRQYSEFSLTSANGYFTAQAQRDGVSAPPLPMDAGRLAVIAQQSIVLDGIMRAAPVSGGRGSELDISSAKLALVSGNQLAVGDIPAGYIGIDVAALNGFGAESVLVGGLRSDTTTGTLITASASNVLVDTRGAALTVPELLLVARAAGDQSFGLSVTSNPSVTNTKFAVAQAGKGDVTIAPGSIITTTGEVHRGSGRNYYMQPAGATAQDVATALGGTLNAAGTQITNIQSAKLALYNAAGGLVSAGDAAALAALQSYAGGGLGALFVASNDTTLTVSGPSGSPNAGLLFAVQGGTFFSVPASPSSVGTVSIGAGASVSTQYLSLQATAQTNAIVIDPAAGLNAKYVALNARTIGILGAGGSAGTDAFTIAPSTLAQLAAAQSLAVKAFAGDITFRGDVSFNPGDVMQRLVLDARSLKGTGGNATVNLNGGTVVLTNTGVAGTAAALTPGSLALNAGVIELAGGSELISGFSTVSFNASDRVYVSGTGGLTLGAATDAVALNITTPLLLVGGRTSGGKGTGAEFALLTNGGVRLARPVGALSEPVISDDIGGNLRLEAARIDIASTVQAQAGTLSFKATTGDITLDDGAFIAAGGYKKTLVDYDTYVAAGKVMLQAAAGKVVTAAGSVIDVSQPLYPEGRVGYGGEVEITSGGDAFLVGAIRSNGGFGLGGRFKLDAGGAAALDPLADLLFKGGVSGTIDIHTRQGNLTLSQGHTLKANNVTLTVDDPTGGNGRITIAGLIDATGYGGKTIDGTGQAGGKVGLYGFNAVALTETAVIDASTAHGDERGGDVTLGVSWDAAWDPVTKTGGIDLAPGSYINVSGGTKGGLSGGTVTVRAPNDGHNDVKVQRLGSRIDGAREVVVEGYVAFSTNGQGGIDGRDLLASDGTHTSWAGIINPGDGVFTGVTITNGGAYSSSNPTGPAITVSAPASGTTPTVQAVLGILGVASLLSSPALSPPPAEGTVLPITFNTPSGGTPAKGTVTIGVGGVPIASSIVITERGSGYNLGFGSVTMTVQGYATNYFVNATGTVVGVRITNQAALDANPPVYTSPPTVTVGAGGTPATAVALFGASAQAKFATDILASVAEGTWVYKNPTTGAVVGSYGFTNAQARLGSYLSSAGTTGTHVRPGIELVNPTTSINNGDITIASNWNLAAGTAYNLQDYSAAYKAQYKVSAGDQYFDYDKSYVKFDYRLGIEPGALTLRAAGNINVNASISDGFFAFRDYQNQDYISAALNSASTNGAGYYGSLRNKITEGRILDVTYYLNYYSPTHLTPLAAYNAALNGKAPTAEALAQADLFPNQLRVCTANCGTPDAVITVVTSPESWSYRLTAGADVASANPNGMKALSTFDAAGALKDKGNIVVNNHTTYAQKVADIDPVIGTNPTATTNVDLPTMVRTGTGDIHVSAARDLILADTVAPGVIYAAGVNTAKLPDPGYQVVNNAIVATNPAGFFEPQILYYGASAVAATGSQTSNNKPLYGPPNAAAFPEKGGDVEIEAQRDIVGYTVSTNTGGQSFQYYAPWLMSYVGVQTVPRGAGAFAPLNASAGNVTASQTAWWIQYGSFDQGFLSAGGNVTVEAGRDLLDVSASVPTTGRVSGGLSVSDVPVTHLYDGGDLTVRAGRNILGGSFYAGSGHGTVVARGSVDAYGTLQISTNTTGAVIAAPNYPVLAVDTGTLSLTAGGSVAFAGVMNPAELHSPSIAAAINPATAPGINAGSVVMDTYGPESAVTVTSITSGINLSQAPRSVAGRGAKTRNFLAATYPASFAAVALGGDITTVGLAVASVFNPGIVLSPSETGVFNLIAQGSIDLTAGFNPSINTPTGRGTFRLSAGPSLIDIAFDPFRPNAWYGTHENDPSYGGATSKVILSHEDDDGKARIYAATVDIRATNAVRDSDGRATGRIQINRPTAIYAGRDIIDLNIIIQNVDLSDVSSITSGRDIYYTGLNNNGGIQVAGPGFLVVSAGRDLGPFLPVAHDNANEAKVQEGIVSVGNATNVPVGNDYVQNAAAVGIYNTAMLGDIRSSEKKRNSLLPTTGADLIVMFGVAKGLDYAAVIDAYINPAKAALVTHNYLPELAGFLSRLGIAAADPDAAWNVFRALPQDLQQIFVNQVYFAELKAVGTDAAAADATGKTANYQRGYQMVNTLFPASLGYTANELTGGVSGAQALVSTGNLNLLHSTIQTQRAGNISILGPGGMAVVGSVATEPNPNLKLRDLGVMTLRGGDINMFMDGSVLVNSSRVLTVLGGDIVMWSSNGDLDAGRGAKTTLSLPPLAVAFDGDGFQSIDAGGLVSGAGIGILKTTAYTSESNLYLMAPRGTIDAGDAGIRVSGSAVFLATEIRNASNITVQGLTLGLPTILAPNIGGLTQASNTAGSAAQQAATPRQGSGAAQPSIIIVEVIGFGGGDGGQENPQKDQRDQRTQNGGYMTGSSVQIIGHGELRAPDRNLLSEDEQQRL
ncbi:filamentous hemagglutinin family protein [Microbacteriaceae bacterium K1510]|nr:filamentous hemagglutinin family protein [Microbacteriaceae bacterium K1510]